VGRWPDDPPEETAGPAAVNDSRKRAWAVGWQDPAGRPARLSSDSDLSSDSESAMPARRELTIDGSVTMSPDGSVAGDS
jgi:hypothetical protein